MAQPRVSFCIALNSDAGKAPEWIELLPAANADGMVIGRDTRAWLWDDIARNAVLQSFKGVAKDLVVDWEHASELRGVKGEEAPAAGWVSEIEIRDGALWGKVGWTPRAESQVLNREYRYLSPVMRFDIVTRRITALESAGLTNKPNLFLTALNHEEQSMSRSASFLAVIASVLCLPTTASDDEIATGITGLQKDRDTAKANNREAPSLDKFVPRADYDVALNRATTAETQLQKHGEDAHAARVDVAIKGALETGKITPVSEGYHRAMCKTADGFEQFQKFIGVAPVVGADTTLGERKTPDNKGLALNSQEQQILQNCGISEKDFRAANAAA